MALWAMGDFHLAFNSDRTMDIFGKVWKDHEVKIRKNCIKRIGPEDTFVITGDHSQSNSLSACAQDLAFIEALPGDKILLRGNHDQFWNAKKTNRLNEEFKGRLKFLQNNYFTYEDYALVGTKGYCFENLDTIEHGEVLLLREAARLRTSFEAARADGYTRFVMFLHYPPTSIGEQESVFTRMAEEYGASHVVYSHCHGEPRWDDSFKGNVNGVEYHLVSGDYLNFKPERIL